MADDFEILKGSDQLSRAQRRQLKKLAARVDKITDADRKFFERFPHREYRVRLAGRAEIDSALLAGGGHRPLLPGRHYYAIIKNVARGVRLRVIAIGDEGWDTDLPDQDARKLYESACSAQRQSEDR